MKFSVSKCSMNMHCFVLWKKNGNLVVQEDCYGNLVVNSEISHYLFYRFPIRVLSGDFIWGGGGGGGTWLTRIVRRGTTLFYAVATSF